MILVGNPEGICQLNSWLRPWVREAVKQWIVRYRKSPNLRLRKHNVRIASALFGLKDRTLIHFRSQFEKPFHILITCGSGQDLYFRFNKQQWRDLTSVSMLHQITWWKSGVIFLAEKLLEELCGNLYNADNTAKWSYCYNMDMKFSNVEATASEVVWKNFCKKVSL